MTGPVSEYIGIIKKKTKETFISEQFFLDSFFHTDFFNTFIHGCLGIVSPALKASLSRSKHSLADSVFSLNLAAVSPLKAPLKQGVY